MLETELRITPGAEFLHSFPSGCRQKVLKTVHDEFHNHLGPLILVFFLDNDILFWNMGCCFETCSLTDTHTKTAETERVV
jgi:hypothetical protein